MFDKLETRTKILLERFLFFFFILLSPLTQGYFCLTKTALIVYLIFKKIALRRDCERRYNLSVVFSALNILISVKLSVSAAEKHLVV